MTHTNLIRVKGKIIAQHGFGNYTVYVEEFNSEVHVTASGKTLMNYHHKLIIGKEITLEVNPTDKTRGRVTMYTLNS